MNSFFSAAEVLYLPLKSAHYYCDVNTIIKEICAWLDTYSSKFGIDPLNQTIYNQKLSSTTKPVLRYRIFSPTIKKISV